MIKKKDWKKTAAILLFIMLLGGYYERLTVETQAMVLPLVIIIAAGIVIARLKQFEYEIRSNQILAHKMAVHTFSVVDSSGNERVSISAETGNAALTLFDESRIPRATLELFQTEPALKLEGDKGSVLISFDKEGRPNLTLKGDGEKIIWTAP
jgi:hypothetical protein